MKFVSLLSLTASRANFIVLHGVVALEAKQDELSYPVFETLITTAVHVDSKPMKKTQNKSNQKLTVFKWYLCILMSHTGTRTFRVNGEIKAIQSWLYFIQKGKQYGVKGYTPRDKRFLRHFVKNTFLEMNLVINWPQFSRDFPDAHFLFWLLLVTRSRNDFAERLLHEPPGHLCGRFIVICSGLGRLTVSIWVIFSK